MNSCISTLNDSSSLLEHEDAISIATEVEAYEHPAWDVCAERLWETWRNAQDTVDAPQFSPKKSAIEAAISWVAYLRKVVPSAPPTYIDKDPNGGIVVEWRVRLPSGDDYICELIFSNDGHAESTDYLNGRVLSIRSISTNPLA